MTNDRSAVEIHIADEAEAVERPTSDTPFQILLVGDFSGGSGEGRKAIAVDRDNLDDILGRLAPAVTVPLEGVSLEIQFHELDDFHPDRLFERLAPFQALRNLRQRLSHASTFEAAAAEMMRRQSPRASAPAPELANLSGADLLRMMTGEEAPARQKAPARSDWDQLVHEMVAPYAVPGPDPRQPELIAQTDSAIAGQMRAILHHPRFQAIESAWRVLDFLVRRLETGEDLKISILDLPQQALVSEAGMAALRRAASDTPRALIAALYYFSPHEEPTLLHVAAVARAASAPVIAGLAPEVVGLEGVFPDLRRSPDARWVGLALPRFLLRLPYGSSTSEIESFAFEEMPATPEHQRYLWGHPAAACACLLAETFSRHGWSMRPGEVDTIEGLPLHVYQADGESQLKPCAEVLLTEDASTLLLERGFIPLVSIKGVDRVRVLRFQSVAEPLAALHGRWMR
jgi:type VI secretion system protein ImpC